VRLQAAGFGALHALSHLGDAASVHHVVGQGAFLEQVLQTRATGRSVDRVCQLGADFGALAVSDRLNEQFAQRSALELEFSKHIEDRKCRVNPERSRPR